MERLRELISYKPGLSVSMRLDLNARQANVMTSPNVTEEHITGCATHPKQVKKLGESKEFRLVKNKKKKIKKKTSGSVTGLMTWLLFSNSPKARGLLVPDGGDRS